MNYGAKVQDTEFPLKMRYEAQTRILPWANEGGYIIAKLQEEDMKKIADLVIEQIRGVRNE